MRAHSLSRRRFLQQQSALLSFGLGACQNWLQADETKGDALVASVAREILINGTETGQSWFHPRCCMVPHGAGSRVFMTLQTITGSDYYQAVHSMTSDDKGHSWTAPTLVPGLGRVERDGGVEEGVCDVVPQWHAPTRSVLAMGHNVYYRGGRLTQPSAERWPTYSVLNEEGTWATQRARLQWDDSRASAMYSCGCGQREVLPNGDLLIPLSYGPKGRAYRDVSTLRCGFDGKTITPHQLGAELRVAKGRGLLEPSVARFRDRYLLTIRAEDGHGYVAVSNDGLDWREMKPWAWEDGSALEMSTTQQHWLMHSEAPYLVYTRKTPENARLMRWRAPLFMARVDPDRLCLIRETEQMVLPIVGDPTGNPKKVPLMGNFHTVAVSPQESWITVGEETVISGGKGNLLVARVHWSRPNEFV